MSAVTNGSSNLAYARAGLSMIGCVGAAAAYHYLPALQLLGVGAAMCLPLGAYFGPYVWDRYSIDRALDSSNITDPKIKDVAKRVLKTIPNDQRQTFVQQLNRLKLLPQDLEEGMKLLQKMDPGERETFVTQLESLKISQEKKLVYAEFLKRTPATERSVIINQIKALGNGMTSEQIEKTATMLLAMTKKQREAFIIHVNLQSDENDPNRFAIIEALYGAQRKDGDLALRRANKISLAFFQKKCGADTQFKSKLFEIVNGAMEHYGPYNNIESFIACAKSHIGLFGVDQQSKLRMLENLAQLDPKRRDAANRFITWPMGVEDRIKLFKTLKAIPDSRLDEVTRLGGNLITWWMDASMRASILDSLAHAPDDKQRENSAAKVGAEITSFSSPDTLNKLLAKHLPKPAPLPLANEMVQEEQLLDFIHSRVTFSDPNDPAQRRLNVDPSQLSDANGKLAQPHRLLLEYFWKANHLRDRSVLIDNDFMDKLFSSLCHKDQTILPMRAVVGDAEIGCIPVLDNSKPGVLSQAKQIECLTAIGTIFGKAMVSRPWDPMLLTGHYFHPILYQMIYSLDATELQGLVDADHLQPDRMGEVHKKLFATFLRRMHGRELGGGIGHEKEIEDLLQTPPIISPRLIGLGLTREKVAQLISEARPIIQATLVIAKAMYASQPEGTWKTFKDTFKTAWMALQSKIEKH